MGKTTKIPEVITVVADVLWENGDGVRTPTAKVHRDAQGRNVLCWIDRTSPKAAGLVWRKDMVSECPS